MKKYLIPTLLILLYSCSKNDSKPTVATLRTAAATNITDSSATLGGTVTNTGGYPILTCGIRYDTNANMARALSIETVLGSTSNSFSIPVKNLPSGAAIYVQAWAGNSAGIAYGNTVQFTTSPAPVNGYTVTTYAGSGSTQSADGPALQAGFQYPLAIAIDPTGVLYSTEGFAGNGGRIRRIATNGYVTTFVPNIGLGGDDVVLDAAGNLFDLDYNKTLYKISPAGVITTFATGFTNPISMDIDKQGNIFLTDAKSLKKITPSGAISKLPLTATTAFIGVAVDPSDNIYVADGSNLERTDTLGNVTILAGAAQGLSTDIEELRIDRNGNIIASDEGNDRLRLITPTGAVTTIAGSGVHGDKDGPALQAKFGSVGGIAIDSANNIFVVDGAAEKIKKITHN